MSEQAAPQYRSAGRAAEATSGWAVGFILFAAIMMIMIGVFQAIAGLVAIFENEFYVATRSYLFQFDATTWGWIHLLAGVIIAFAGWGLLSGRTWARVAGIILAVLSAIANFAFLPYYPFWALTIIALDVLVIWALAAHGRALRDSTI
jgi:tetrahydromethanopterin S-methyltransferase subunit F